MHKPVTPNNDLVQFFNEHCKDKDLNLVSLELILALIKEIQELKKKKDKTHEQ